MTLPVLSAGWLPESQGTAPLEKPPWAQLDPVSLDDQGPGSPQVLSPLGLALTRQCVRTKAPHVRGRRGFRSLVCPPVSPPVSRGCLPASSSTGSLLVTACLSAVLETESGTTWCRPGCRGCGREGGGEAAGSRLPVCPAGTSEHRAPGQLCTELLGPDRSDRHRGGGSR